MASWRSRRATSARRRAASARLELAHDGSQHRGVVRSVALLRASGVHSRKTRRREDLRALRRKTRRALRAFRRRSVPTRGPRSAFVPAEHPFLLRRRADRPPGLTRGRASRTRPSRADRADRHARNPTRARLRGPPPPATPAPRSRSEPPRKTRRPPCARGRLRVVTRRVRGSWPRRRRGELSRRDPRLPRRFALGGSLAALFFFFGMAPRGASEDASRAAGVRGKQETRVLCFEIAQRRRSPRGSTSVINPSIDRCELMPVSHGLSVSSRFVAQSQLSCAQHRSAALHRKKDER